MEFNPFNPGLAEPLRPTSIPVVDETRWNEKVDPRSRMAISYR
jgi:hypothetical protein